MISLLVCLQLLSVAGLPSSHRAEALEVCRAVADEAQAQGVDPALATALSFHESRLSWNATSRAGAVGPLQILPRWSSCDSTARGCQLWQGVAHLAGWLKRTPTEREAIGRYNAGYRTPLPEKTTRWAGAVINLANKIRGNR